LRAGRYRIDPATGGQTLLGTVSQPHAPTFLALDRTGHFMLSAYYQGGGAAVYHLGTDGMVALGRLTLSRRERMVMVEPRGTGLALFTLRAAGEVRAPQFDSQSKGIWCKQLPSAASRKKPGSIRSGSA
jgi:hypothetical protein